MDASAANALNAHDAAALLAAGPFAAAFERGGALVIVTGQPARVAFATPAGLAMFGAADLAALEAAALDARSPGARRFRQLAQSLAVGAAPRTEQLRFFVGGSPLLLGLRCARIAGPNGAKFLVASAPKDASSEAPPPEPGLEAETPMAEPAPPSFVAQPLDGPIRFLWNLDSEDRFGSPDPALAVRLGPTAPAPGESLHALCARLGFDPAGTFVEALATRRTFSALRVDWPEPGFARARVASMSGAPQFDRDRKFLGFRGFGVFTGESAPVDQRPVVTTRREAAPTLPPPEASPPPTIETQPIEPAEISQPSTPAVAPSISRGESSVFPTAAEEETENAPSAAPKGGWEGSAAIFVLRPTAPSSMGGPNVVPLRPGSVNAPPPPSPPSAPEASGGEEDIVELSSQERDAFREIARALGARMRPPRSDRGLEESGEPLAKPITPAHDEAPEPVDSIVAGSPSPSGGEEDAVNCDAAALLDVLPIGALVLRGGEAIYLNRTLLDLVGFANIEEFRAANGLAQIFRGRDPTALAGVGEDDAMPMIAAGGELTVVDAVTRPISWGGTPATLVALRRSREAEHQSRLRALEVEAQLAAARARAFAAALDMAADGMVRLDAEGRILAMTPRAESLFGYDQKEAAGENFIILLAPSSQPDAIARFEAVREAAASDGGRGIEAVARGSGGVSIPVRLSFGRLAVTPEPEYCAIFHDLSEVRAAELAGRAASEKAEKASASKGDFLARVSHEIRTPLHAILGFAEVMMGERFGPIGNDRYKDYVKDIHASAQHIMSLANDLLDLTKIEAGRMELAFSAVDANRIIRECVTLMQPQAARERIIMRLSLFDKLPNVMADERALRQIILNLMSNAVKFNEPGGQVIVSTALDEFGHPVIRVRDTGVGMNESELSVALQPFGQIPGGRRDEGAGLGLPLTKALAEANHADFSIKSRKEHGTLVEVAFPSVRAAQ